MGKWSMAGTHRIIYSTVFLPVTALLMILHRGGEGVTDDVSYLGCYNLTDITSLSIVAVSHYQNENLTVVLCTRYCDNNVGDDALVALSKPTCRCLLPTALLSLSERCRLPCPGSESDECGGAHGLSTFYSVYNQSVKIQATSINTTIVAIGNAYGQSTVSSAMTSQRAGDSGANTWTQTPQTTAGTDRFPRNIVISVVLTVILAIIIAVILAAWAHFRRRNQRHSFQDDTQSGNSAPESTFRVMPAWEYAISNSTMTYGKQGSTTQCNVDMYSCTPDLLADTSANGDHHRNTHGQFQNVTTPSETTLETDVDEKKMYEFDNLALDINLDEILNIVPSNSTIRGNGGANDSSLQDENDLITSTSNASFSSLDKTGSTDLVNVSDSSDSVCSNPYDENTTAAQTCFALKCDDRFSGEEEDVVDGKYMDVDYRTISSRLVSPEMDVEVTCDVKDGDNPIDERSKVLVDLKTGLDDGIQISKRGIQSETGGTLRNSLTSVGNTDSSLNLDSGERERRKCLSEDEARTSMKEAPLQSTDKKNLNLLSSSNTITITTDSPSSNVLDSWKSRTGNSLCDEKTGGIETQCGINTHLPMAVLNTETDVNDSISTGEEECTSTNGTDPLSDISGNDESPSQFASNGNQMIENSKEQSISVDGEISHPIVGSYEAHYASSLPHHFEESTSTGGDSLSLNASADSENSSEIRPNENSQNVKASNLDLDLSEGESYDEKEKHWCLTEMPGDPLFDPS